MGQTYTIEGQSADGTFVLHDTVTRHAKEMKQLAVLPYTDFIKSLEQVNKITDSFSDSSGKKMLFHVKKGSDSTFLWKATVRIKCHKVNGLTGGIESTRLLNLKQFVHLFNEIQRYVAVASVHKQGAGGSRADTIDFSASMILTEIDSHLGTQGRDDTEKEECCICMEHKSDIILRCSHSYCEKCIDQWYVMNKTCPICRANVNTGKDSWVLTEKPDTDQMAKEASAYLMGLSDKSGYKDPDDT